MDQRFFHYKTLYNYRKLKLKIMSDVFSPSKLDHIDKKTKSIINGFIREYSELITFNPSLHVQHENIIHERHLRDDAEFIEEKGRCNTEMIFYSKGGNLENKQQESVKSMTNRIPIPNVIHLITLRFVVGFANA